MVWTPMERDQIFTPVIKMGGELTLVGSRSPPLYAEI